MAVALKVNGVACRDLKKRNGVAKLSVDNYNGTAHTSPSPIIYYTFEDHDTAIEDYSESGTDHDGTGSGTERDDTSAKRGTYSLKFEAGAPDTEHIEIAHHADINWDHDDPWTISGWVIMSSAIAGYRGLYVKRESAGNDYTGPAVFFATVSGNQCVTAYLISDWTSQSGDPAAYDAAIYKESTVTIDDNDWHHVVVTYDGSGGQAGMLCYIDGSLDSTFAVAESRTTVAGKPTTNSVVARVGGDTANLPTAQYSLSAWLDEFAIWNVALTANQVSVLYNSGTPAAIASGL